MQNMEMEQSETQKTDTFVNDPGSVAMQPIAL